MYPMLQVQAPDGLIYLNGRFCGEAGGSGLPLTRDGTVYLEYRPFSGRGEGLALRLSLKAGSLTDGLPEEAFAVQWPDGLIQLELRLPQPTPVSVNRAHLDTPLGRLFLVETGNRLSLGFDPGSMVDLDVEGPFGDVALRTQPHPMLPLIAVSGSGGQGPFTAVIRLDRPPVILQSVEGKPAEWSPDGSLRTLQNTPADVARAWLEAVQAGAMEEASRFLRFPQQNSQLAAQAGSYDSVVPLQQPVPGLAPVEWGLLTVQQPQLAQVRALGFVLSQEQESWKIDRLIPY